jgi:hypothetical protein
LSLNYLFSFKVKILKIKAKFILITTILISIPVVFYFIFSGNEYLWGFLNIPACSPHLLDSRQIGYAAESHALGYDPMYENPMNPRGHQLNYPRIWQILFALNLNRENAYILGSVFVISFFIGLIAFLLPKKIDYPTAIILLPIIYSPVVLFGIERGNIEIFVFFVLSLAIVTNYYSRILGYLTLLFASIIKLYPIFGFVYLLKENKKRFWILFLIALGIFAIYALLTWNDLKQIYLTTPNIAKSSYGMNVFRKGLVHKRILNLNLSEDVLLIAKILTFTLAFVIIITTLFLSQRKNVTGLYKPGEYIDAFRVGAGIYIGCFFTIDNFDYRLMFLIFTIPQLVSWLKEGGISA